SCGRSFFFVFEPLLASKQVFDSLPSGHQQIIMSVGEELEPFGLEGSKSDDKTLEEIYRKAGAEVNGMDDATLGLWREVARESAWKDFAARTPNTAKFLKLAENV